MADDLQNRLAELSRTPEHEKFARKLSAALSDIRREFHGDARVRLEAMVDEALTRQLERIESRKRADAALEDLERSQADLVQALYGVLLRIVPDEGATRH